MKPNFKIDFSKRDVIAMVCFTVVMILVLILGNTFGYVSADDNVDAPTEEEETFDQGTWNSSSVLNYTSWTTSSIYDSNYYFNSSCYSDSILTDFMSAFNDFDIPTSGYHYSVVGNDGEVDFSAISGSASYVVCRNYVDGSPNDLSFSVTFFGDNCFLNFNDNGIYSNDCWVLYLRLIYHQNTQTISVDTKSAYLIANWTQLPSIEYGDTKLWKADFSGTPIFCNAPLYGYNLSVSDPNFAEFVSSGLSSTSYKNVNYMLFDGSYSAPGSSSGETSANNLYLNNPYWSFNLPHNNQLTSVNGTCTFNAVSTQYQEENPGQFELHYWFQIDVTYTYTDSGDGGFSGGGHGFCILNSIQPNNTLGTSTTRSRTGVFKYRYDGSDYAVSPFTDFDGSQTFQTITVGTGWNKIFRQCYLSGNTSYNTFYDWWDEYGSTTDTTGDMPKVISAKLKCYAQLFDSSSSSGVCSYYYDFLTGESGVLDDSMGTNSNPYDFDTQDQYTNQSSGYGYVVQNNNNNQSVVVNTNVESGEFTDKLEQILGGDDDDEDGGLTDSFKDKAQSNNWLVIMNAIFSFVPNSVWIDLGIFLVTCLGILAAFLILRFLLDLL